MPSLRATSTTATLGLVLAALLGACSPSGVPARRPAPTSTTDATAQLPGRLFFTRTTTGETSGDVQSVFVAEAGGTRQLTEPGQACCLLRASPNDDRVLTLPGGELEPPLTGATLDVADAAAALVPLPRTDPTLSLVPQAWSPDGSRIAFEGWDDDDPSRTGVYTARADDGGGLVRVTSRPGVFHDVPLDYSPDGTQLVVYRSTHPDPDPYTDGSLWVLAADGTGGHQISSPETPPTVWARWSPDGTQIVFVLDPVNDWFMHPANRVYVISADGEGLRLVDASPDFKSQPEWVD